YRPRARRYRARSRGRAREDHARRVQAQRAPLADPARTLRVQSAEAELPRVLDRRSLRISGEDAGADDAALSSRAGRARLVELGDEQASVHELAGGRIVLPVEPRFPERRQDLVPREQPELVGFLRVAGARSVRDLVVEEHARHAAVDLDPALS